MSSVSVFRGVDFSGTDWGERNIVIAERLGVDPGLVAAAKRHFDMVLKPRVDWSDVDFDRPLAEIAKENGVTVAAVMAAKKAAGLQRDRIDLRDADWGKPDSAIAREYGCSVATVWRARKRMGRELPPVDGEGTAGLSAAERAKDRSTRTISVLFSREDFKALSEAAEAAGKTKTAVIREAVAAWIVMHK